MPGTGTPTYRSERNAPRQQTEPAQTRPLGQLAGGSRPAEPSPWLARSLARTQARSRLETDLRAIAVDLLGRCQPEELPTDSSEWLTTVIEMAVTRVRDASLAALAETIDIELAAAPPGVVRHLREAEARHDAGLF